MNKRWHIYKLKCDTDSCRGNVTLYIDYKCTCSYNFQIHSAMYESSKLASRLKVSWARKYKSKSLLF